MIYINRTIKQHSDNVIYFKVLEPAGILGWADRTVFRHVGQRFGLCPPYPFFPAAIFAISRMTLSVPVSLSSSFSKSSVTTIRMSGRT